MNRTTLFLGGIPTKPDVDKLRAAFGVPKVGELILHERYEDALGMKRTVRRLKTVRYEWHKKLETEHACFMEAVPGKGYARLSLDGRIEHAAGKEKRSFRMLRKALAIVARTDQTGLTAENRKVAESITRRNAAVRLALATEAKAITLPDLEKRGN